MTFSQVLRVKTLSDDDRAGQITNGGKDACGRREESMAGTRHLAGRRPPPEGVIGSPGRSGQR